MLQKFRSRASALFFALVAAMVAAPAAFAQTSTLGDTVSAAITATNPEITKVIGAMAAALVLIVAWVLIRKSFSGK